MPGIYIHIPFCRQACHYCDFHFSTSLKQKEDFLNALLKEIELQQDYLYIPSHSDGKINSVYFGGGTPSVLSEKEINNILFHLSKFHPISNDAEITLEANPDDLNREYLASLRSTPVNRLSIGIQSFSDADLRYMNRIHNAQAATTSVELAADTGFTNLTLDLIYGTPTMTNNSWIENLHTAFSLPVNHLSCYALTVEPKTTLSTMIKKGISPQVEDKKMTEQFELLMQLSRNNGFEQYEISNFCRNEKYSVHNSSYWKGAAYLGLGPSAHSYNGASRQWNLSNNSSYIKSLLNGKLNFEMESLTTEQKYNEYILTTLRTKWGTSSKNILEQYGARMEEHFLKEADRFLKQELLSEKEYVFYLSDKGKLFADKIASELFYVSG